MRPTLSPNISPLRFLRIVAAEYLAAYELTGNFPAALKDDPQARETDEFLRRLEAEDVAPVLADVIDISMHPRFDGSALRREWVQSPDARPSIGA